MIRNAVLRPHSGYSYTPSPPKPSVGPELGWHHFSNFGTYPFPRTAAQKAVFKAAIKHQFIRSGNGGGLLGSGTTTTLSTPFDQYVGISQLDTMVSLCTDPAMKRANGMVWLDLFPPPWCMTGATNYTEAQNTLAAVLPANYAIYTDWCAWVANRYGGVVDGFIANSECKGMYDNANNRWDWPRAVAQSDAAYDGIHAAAPQAAYGGGYMTTHQALSTNGAAKGGWPKFTTLEPVASFVGVDRVVSNTYGWYVDARTLDNMYYFINHTSKYTHFLWDGWAMQETDPTASKAINSDMAPPAGVTWTDGQAGTVTLGSGTVVMDDHTRFAMIADKIESWLPTGKKQMCVETYTGDGTNAGAKTVTFWNLGEKPTELTGLDVMAWWGESDPALVDFLFDTNGIVTPIGQTFINRTTAIG